MEQGLLRQAALALDEHLSMHPALRTDNPRERNFPPLSPVG